MSNSGKVAASTENLNNLVMTMLQELHDIALSVTDLNAADKEFYTRCVNQILQWDGIADTALEARINAEKPTFGPEMAARFSALADFYVRFTAPKRGYALPTDYKPW